MVEAKALLWGLMIAREKGWKKLWIGDSKLVIGAMKGGNIKDWRLESILLEVRARF